MPCAPMAVASAKCAFILRRLCSATAATSSTRSAGSMTSGRMGDTAMRREAALRRASMRARALARARSNCFADDVEEVVVDFEGDDEDTPFLDDERARDFGRERGRDRARFMVARV